MRVERISSTFLCLSQSAFQRKRASSEYPTYQTGEVSTIARLRLFSPTLLLWGNCEVGCPLQNLYAVSRYGRYFVHERNQARRLYDTYKYTVCEASSIATVPPPLRYSRWYTRPWSHSSGTHQEGYARRTQFTELNVIGRFRAFLLAVPSMKASISSGFALNRTYVLTVLRSSTTTVRFSADSGSSGRPALVIVEARSEPGSGRMNRRHAVSTTRTAATAANTRYRRRTGSAKYFNRNLPFA